MTSRLKEDLHNLMKSVKKKRNVQMTNVHGNIQNVFEIIYRKMQNLVMAITMMDMLHISEASIESDWIESNRKDQ